MGGAGDDDITGNYLANQFQDMAGRHHQGGDGDDIVYYAGKIGDYNHHQR